VCNRETAPCSVKPSAEVVEGARSSSDLPCLCPVRLIKSAWTAGTAELVMSCYVAMERVAVCPGGEETDAPARVCVSTGRRSDTGRAPGGRPGRPPFPPEPSEQRLLAIQEQAWPGWVSEVVVWDMDLRGETRPLLAGWASRGGTVVGQWVPGAFWFFSKVLAKGGVGISGTTPAGPPLIRAAWGRPRPEAPGSPGPTPAVAVASEAKPSEDSMLASRCSMNLSADLDEDAVPHEPAELQRNMTRQRGRLIWEPFARRMRASRRLHPGEAQYIPGRGFVPPLEPILRPRSRAW